MLSLFYPLKAFGHIAINHYECTRLKKYAEFVNIHIQFGDFLNIGCELYFNINEYGVIKISDSYDNFNHFHLTEQKLGIKLLKNNMSLALMNNLAFLTTFTGFKKM